MKPVWPRRRPRRREPVRRGARGAAVPGGVPGYGLTAGEGEPKVVAARIRQRPAAVREAIFAALDEWDELAGNEKLSPCRTGSG